MSTPIAPKSSAQERKPFDDPTIAGLLLGILRQEDPRIMRVFNLTIDDQDVFRGNAAIPGAGANGGDLYLAFRIDPNTGRLGFKGANARRSDAWHCDANHVLRTDAPRGRRAGMRLNCRPGNVQCGGKCQGAGLNCFADLPPEQQAAAKRAARLARRLARGATTPTTPTPNSTPRPTTPTPNSTPRPTAPTTPTPRSALPAGVKLATREVTPSYKIKTYSFTVGEGTAATKYQVEIHDRERGEAAITFTRGSSTYARRRQTADAEQDAIAAIKIARIIKSDVAARPDGFQYSASAYKADGSGVYRGYSYQKFGFSRPVDGETGGYQFAVVKNGKLEPDEGKLETYESQSDRVAAARNWKRNLTRLENKRQAERSARRGEEAKPKPTPTKKRPAKPERKLPDGVKVSKMESPFAALFPGNDAGITKYEFKIGTNKYAVEVTRAGDKRIISFEANDSYRRTVSDPRVAAQAAIKIARIVQYDVAGAGNGAQYSATAYTGDGSGNYRAYAYERQGFSRPVNGVSGGGQFAIVKNGKLTPDTKTLKDYDLNYEKANADWADTVQIINNPAFRRNR